VVTGVNRPADVGQPAATPRDSHGGLRRVS